MTQTNPSHYTAETTRISPVNWTTTGDTKDKEVWDRITTRLWLPEQFSLSDDKKSWATLTPLEQDTTLKVIASLSLTDTIQATVGIPSILPMPQRATEQAVYTAFSYAKSVHAKSYSRLLKTFADPEQIKQAFRWAEENDHLQNNAKTVLNHFHGTSALHKKVCATACASFLNYAGLYLPMYWATHGKMGKTADLIRMIVDDSAVHSYYLGYSFQQELATCEENTKLEIKEFVFDLVYDLYDEQADFTEDVYDDLHVTEDSKRLLRQAANKLLANLGYEPLFPADECRVSPAITSALTPNSEEARDFQQGTSHNTSTAESTEDDDWDF